MANWSDLKASVAEVIKTNGNQEITGQILQNALNSIISNLGENATFAGIAIPTINPGVPDGPVFYFAFQSGVYYNFNGIRIEKIDNVKILKWDGSNWDPIDTGLPNNTKVTELVTEISNELLSEVDKKVQELSDKVDNQKKEVDAARDEAIKAINDEEQDAISNFNSQRVTPDMLSESTLQLINSSGGGIITNMADDEDLYSTGGDTNVLKFKDKDYVPKNFSGIGRVYLRKNIQLDKNILAQDMVNKSNTRYIIQYDYDLNGAEITIPEGCILDFQGGSFSNGTLNLNNTAIIGNLGGLNYDIILDGEIKGEAILFDWWKNEKTTKQDYNNFINDSNNVYGNIPEISTVNRIIFNNHSKKYSIKFGNGIYPFDDSVNSIIKEICGFNRRETLLWFPNSEAFHNCLSTSSSIHDIWIESKLYTIYIENNYYPHAPVIKDADFRSYEDNVFHNLGGLYGGLFQNLTVYSPANKETAGFYGFGSNSNVFINVVDGHLFFNGKATNKKGKMFALFYNCSAKDYTEFNVTYSGFKYLFYYNYNILSSVSVSIHDGTVESGYNSEDDYSLNRILHFEKNGSFISIKYFNVLRIGNPKDNVDFYLRGCTHNTFDKTQEGIKCFIASNINNAGDDTIIAQTNPLDLQGTIPRIVIAFPKYKHNESSLYKGSKSIYERYGIPTEWYDSYSSLPGFQSSGNNIPIYLPDNKSIVGSYKKLKLEKEFCCRLLFLDDESEKIVQIPIIQNHYAVSSIEQLAEIFKRNISDAVINIISDIDMKGARQMCRAWTINFYGNLNNGTLAVNNKVKLINFRGNAVIEGSTKDYGPKNARPINALKGDLYFDTTINKPIWWTGTKWVYADGEDA